jgi:acetoin utilization deacetylase AcuC-like enzyme
MVWGLRLKIIYDQRHSLHRDPYGRHPEDPRRVEEGLAALRASEAWGYIDLVNPPEPDYSAALMVHDEEYVDRIKRESSLGFHYIDPDTYVNEYTFEIASIFATAAREAALSSIASGEPYFIMSRPGGHHAGRRGRAMGAPTLGFCIFDYTSIAAKALFDNGYRVMILDIDAHHGNGSQEILWLEPRALHIDIHQTGIYPGTGGIWSIGGGVARGTKINIPLERGSGDSVYSWILSHVIEPARKIYEPDFLIVFAGLDAHMEDPLTGLEVTEDTYAMFGSYVGRLLERGEIAGSLSILGGGYGEGAITSFVAYVEAMLGIREQPVIGEEEPSPGVVSAIPGIMDLLRDAATRIK